MSLFRSKRLDLSGFINARVIRDHTKRKVFEQHEPERYAKSAFFDLVAFHLDKDIGALSLISWF